MMPWLLPSVYLQLAPKYHEVMDGASAQQVIGA